MLPPPDGRCAGQAAWWVSTAGEGAGRRRPWRQCTPGRRTRWTALTAARTAARGDGDGYGRLASPDPSGTAPGRVSPCSARASNLLCGLIGAPDR